MVRIRSARLFGYQHVGISSGTGSRAKCWGSRLTRWGPRPTRDPNTKEFALWLNVDLTKIFNGRDRFYGIIIPIIESEVQRRIHDMFIPKLKF